jgi:hypothetical protein
LVLKQDSELSMFAGTDNASNDACKAFIRLSKSHNRLSNASSPVSETKASNPERVNSDRL